MTIQEFLTNKGLLTHSKSVFVISGDFGTVTLNELLEEYAQQQLSAERERAGKLVEAVQSFVQASDDFNIGYINRNGEITRCGIAALSVAFNAAEKRLRIALTESNKP
jgi:hypothetical protein